MTVLLNGLLLGPFFVLVLLPFEPIKTSCTIEDNEVSESKESGAINIDPQHCSVSLDSTAEN